MNNVLHISAHSFYEDLRYYSEYQYIFYYNLLVADRKVAEPCLKKWAGKDELLSRLPAILLSEKDMEQNLREIPECQIENESDRVTRIENRFTTQQNIVNREIRYAWDFRGIRIFKSNIQYSFHGLDYARVDYSLIEQSTFIGGKDVFKNFSGFFNVSFNHSRFSECSFIDVSFRSGEYNNVVFYFCKFTNVKFDGHGGNYSNILFQNCEFDDADFTDVDITTFCFFGDCKFNAIKIDSNADYTKIIGGKIISWTVEKDRQTYRFRKTIKGSKGDKSLVYFEKNDKKPTGRKWYYSSFLYQGLASFYNTVKTNADNHGEYDLYWILYYNFAYCRDSITKNSNTLQKRIKIVINRNFFGYGFRYEKTLVFILFLIIFGSFIYPFTGISYNRSIIKRSLTFNARELNSTIHDWLKCVYFSLKATTSVGFGDFSPTSHLSLILSILQGCLGFISFTIFIVIFSRRFFK